MHHLSFRTALAVIAASLGTAFPLTAQVGTRFQGFAVNPGWTTIGSGTGGNNFGYSATTFTGGSTGEGGGRFTRDTTFRYYADTNLGGSLNLNQPLTASGRFDHTVANTPDFVNGLFIGHFSASENYAVGIFFTNGGSDPSKLAWGINVRGDMDNILSLQTSLDANVDRDWSYTWDPTGGVGGLGRLTATLSGPGGGSKSVDMPPGTFVRPNAMFDAFGLNATTVDSANMNCFADVYIDDVSYSIPVPEPMIAVGLTLACLIGQCLCRQSRNG